MIGTTERVEKKLKKHEFSGEEILLLMDGDVEDHVNIFRDFEPLDCYERIFGYEGISLQDTSPMQRYVDELRGAGLDMGRGGAEFGYKMPLPDREAVERVLIIFRR